MSRLGSARVRIAALAGVIAVLLAAGSWIAVTRAPAHANSRASGTRGSSRAPTLSVVSVTPAEGSTAISGAAPITVKFSAALAPSSPLPFVRPAIAGNWRHVGTDSVRFTPARGWGQHVRVRVRIPGGDTGVRSAHGAVLGQSQLVRFRTGRYARTRVPELLAQLGYLPLHWTPASGRSAPPVGTGYAAQAAAAFSPPSGTYRWRPGYPQPLRRFWNNGAASGMIIHGAVMAFESDHHLTMDGVVGPAVWKALLTAAARGTSNPHGYTYAVASQHSPESLTVWHNGKVILHTLANTGIPAAPTTVGTAAVYLRYTFQIMKGTNPDGSKYADPVSWVSYFRAGEAVHYFARGSYGYQQSLGCVELPYKQAKFVWPFMTYGTLVTVTPA